MQDKEGGGGGVKVQYQRFSQSEAWESVCAGLLGCQVCFVQTLFARSDEVCSDHSDCALQCFTPHACAPKALSLLHTVTEVFKCIPHIACTPIKSELKG